jgi:hypothetical protein
MRALCRRPADFHVEYLVAPTKEEFDAAYTEVDPHVLHVVAHGEQSYGETVLSLRAGEEGAWSLTRVHVANRLPSYPRLVVLNACRSGAGSAATEAAWGFAELFLDKGVGAVVTMQGDIPAVEAVAFTEAFYTALAAREPVDVATHQGRLAVYDETDSPRVWSIPTLSLGAPPESILGTPEPRPASSRLEAVVVEAVGYVDRATERRRVWTRAAPDGPRKPPRLLVVTGGDRTGKSAVVKGALPACHARGCDIAYVDFGPSTRLGWFAAVKRVYDDLRDWLPEHDAPMRHFADVAETCRTGPYHEGRPGPMRELGEELRFENEGDVGEHRKKVIFRELLHLVEACGTENKLLLVLDHLFTGLSDEARDDYLLPRLVQPLLDEEESNVVLVAVVPKNYQLSLSGPAAALEPVEVKAFEKPEFELLLREYVARTKPDAKLLPDQKLLVKTLAGMKQSWEVRDLTIYGAAAAQ